jgi:hypothetical protein
MTNYNKLYIQSLVDFILDTKPYHSKLTEVIQELKFSESISVSINDSHQIKTTLSSIWSETYYSDGARNRFLLPPIFNPRYSLESNQYKNLSEVDYLTSNFGLPNCYQFNNCQGVESVYSNNSIKIEGLDYYVSKGFFSFSTEGTSYYKNNSTLKNSGTIVYNNYSENPYMAISDINVEIGKESFWKLEITDTNQLVYSTNKQIFNLKSSGDYFYRIVENNQYVIPKNNYHISDIETSFIFDSAIKKDIFLISSLYKNVYSVDEASNIWIINHNLESSTIIPLVFVNSNNNYFEIEPIEIIIIDDNTIKITLTDTFSGKVLIKSGFKQIQFNSKELLISDNIRKNLKYKAFGYTSNGIILLDSDFSLTDKLIINFDKVYSGFINFYDESFETQFSVTDLHTNTLIGYGCNRSHFISNGLSFYADFGSVLELGESSIIRPTNEIAISSNIEDEVWSIIKINPIPFKITNNQIVTSNNSNILIIPYAPHFVNSPAEIWTFTFDGDTFSISGSISGSNFTNIKLGPWYENDYLKIKIVNPNIPFDPSRAYDESYLNWYTNQTKHNLQIGDSFTLEILDKKPNYIVYGSKSKSFEFATIGDYFWNGKIGFMPSKPFYRINGTEFIDPLENPYLSSYDTLDYGEFYDIDLITQDLIENTVFQNNQYWFLEDHYPLQWNIYKGTPFLNSELKISFNKSPRFDAVDETFTLSYDENLNSGNQFNVYSNLFGQLPSAILGYDYSNFETTKITQNTSGNINFKLEGVNIVNSSIIVQVVSNFIKGSHSQDVLIFKEPISDLKINTFNNDILQFEILNREDFKLGYSDSNKNIIPSFIKLSKLDPKFLSVGNSLDFGSIFSIDQFPGSLNRSETYDLFLNNSTTSKIGTISNVFDTDAGFNRKVIDFDVDFASRYLPINTEFKFTSIQTDEYNHQVGTLITEEIRWADKIKFFDTINVSVIDSILHIPGYDIADFDQNFYDVNEQFSTLLVLNRDIFPIITEDSKLVIRVPFVVKHSIYDNINLVVRDKFLLNTDVNTIARTNINDNGLTIISNFISADQTIPNLALYDIPEFYDINPYELNPEGITIFEKMDKPILVIPNNVSIATIELVGFNNLKIATNVNDLEGSLLIPNVDYGVNKLNSNTFEIIFLYDPQPVVFIAE